VVASDFPIASGTATRRRASPGWFLAVGAVLAGWTAAIFLTSSLSFHLHSAQLRAPVEAAGATVIVLVCALAYIQYSLTNTPIAFFTGLAFLALGANHIVFGVLLGTGRLGITAQQEMYFWTVGRLVAGLLLVGATVRRLHWAKLRRPSTRFLAGSVVVLAMLGAIQGILWLFRSHLPPLSSVASDVLAASAHGPLPGLTLVDLALGVSGTALFLLAAGIYQRRLISDPWALPWLPVGLLLAAFSHLHYMYFPTIFSDRISTGDVLRQAMMLVFAGGLIWEVRRLYRQRAEQLAAAYELERRRVIELERLDRSRHELFSILTHELLHPVATIRALAVTLTNRWDTTSEEARLRLAFRVEAESRRLRELAEEASTVTSPDGEILSLVLRPEPALELAREAAEIVDDLGGRLKVIVEPHAESILVQADRARVLQALRNLLSNAEKYSEEGTPIELALSGEDGQVTFSVKNLGPGIGAEDLPSLFQKFSRTRPPGKETVPGTGLGLYIAKRIVESHGGRIWVESWPGMETTFSFDLPATTAPTHSTVESTV
jgi:signal transduction histidine kinase